MNSNFLLTYDTGLSAEHWYVSEIDLWKDAILAVFDLYHIRG